MRDDHEKFLKANVSPAIRTFADTVFEKRLRDLIVGPVGSIELIKFIAILSFAYGAKASIEGVNLLDDAEEEIIYMREVDGGTDNACWVPDNRSNPDAKPFKRIG